MHQSNEPEELPQLIFDPTNGHFFLVPSKTRAIELMIEFENYLLEADQTRIVLPAAIIEATAKAKEGAIVRALSIPWREIVDELKKNKDFLYEFVDNPRLFEEFLAASHTKHGASEVVLTPRSGDLGRDVIAVYPEFKVRIFDQAKALSPNRTVSADDVRAMFGVINLEPNVSKAVITTTSTFAPKVKDEFERVMPFRLELKSGTDLIEWVCNVPDDS